MRRPFLARNNRECQASRAALAPGLSRTIKIVRGLTPPGSPKCQGCGSIGVDRSGITLTQMLVVITLTSIITTAAISIIVTMLRLEGRTIQVWMTQQTLLQLGDDFREDAHAAQSAEISTQNQAATLIFRSGEVDVKSVAYVATENQVIRRETAGDKLLRTETYRLPEGEVLFGGTSSGDEPIRLSLGQSVRLTCRRPNVEAINRRTPAPRHDEHVIAVLGRDHRLEKP